MFTALDVLPDSVLGLAEREQYVVASVIWDRKTLRVIASDMQLSVRTVRRIRDRGFAQLKLHLEAR